MTNISRTWIFRWFRHHFTWMNFQEKGETWQFLRLVPLVWITQTREHEVPSLPYISSSRKVLRFVYSSSVGIRCCRGGSLDEDWNSRQSDYSVQVKEGVSVWVLCLPAQETTWSGHVNQDTKNRVCVILNSFSSRKLNYYLFLQLSSLVVHI